MEKKDRRVFRRFPVNLSVTVLDRQANRWALAGGQDLSAKGIGILIERELPPSTPLEMWIPIPQAGESYYTKGMVVWSKMIEAEKYRAGISLEKVDLMGMSQIFRKI